MSIQFREEHLKVAENIRTSHLVVQSGAFALAGNVTHLVVSLFSGLIVARVIGPSAYGIFSIGRTLCQFVNIFTKAGFDLGLVKRFGEAQSSFCNFTAGDLLRAVIVAVSGLSLIPVFFVYLGGGVFLQMHFYSYPHFRDIIAIMILAVPFMTLSQVLGAAFRGSLRIVPNVVALKFIQPTSRLVIILILFIFGWRLYAVIWGTVLSFVICTSYLLVLARRNFFENKIIIRSFNWEGLLSVGSYSLIFFLSTSVAFLFRRADILMLGYFSHSTEVGKYAIVQMIVSVIPVINMAFMQIIAPLVAKLWAQGEIEHLTVLIRRHVYIMVLSSFPLFLTLAVVGDQLMLILGRGYDVAIRVILELALAQVITAALSATGFLLSMTGRHVVEFYLLLLTLIVNIGLNYILIPMYGIEGAAIASLVAVFLANFLRVCCVYFTLHIFPIGRGIGGPIALSLLVFGVFFLLRSFTNIVDGFTSALVASVVFLILNYFLAFGILLNEHEKALIVKRWSKSV